MKSILTCIFGLFYVVIFGQSDQERSLDQMIQKGMEDWQVPGLSAIVVKDGEVVFHHSYGVKDLESGEEVNGNTLFTMASTTKALIAISMGILVDQGKVKWDDKVRMHYPEFRLSDAYITEDARIQDLLTHNLGMGDSDMLWIMDSLTTEETLRRFGLAEPAYPLRGGYTYQNLMYVYAGEVVSRISGMPWREFVQQQILDPLDMARTQTYVNEVMNAGNYVTPYFNDLEEGVIEVDYTRTDQIGAAGMLWTCTNDIANYLTFLINDGVYKGDTILQPVTFAKLFEPHSFIPAAQFYPTHVLTKPNWRTYGLAWFQHDYRGDKLDFHTGSIWGLVAIAGIMHEHNTAVYVLANLDHAELRHAILYKAMDLWAYDDDSRDWHGEVFDLYSGFREKAKEGLDKQKESRIPDTKTTLPLQEYTGTYHHDMWGDVTITEDNGVLMANVNDHRHYKLSHWHYDTFKGNVDPDLRFVPTFSFNIGQNGAVMSYGEGKYLFVKTNK